MRKRRRAPITYKTLSYFEEGGFVENFLTAFLSSGKSTHAFRSGLRGKSKKISSRLLKEKEEQKITRRLLVMISRLEREGLLTSEGRGTSKHCITTSRGKKLSSPQPSYSQEKSNSLVLVMFDIPEKSRKERNWLRSVLQQLSFEMIQKSVWMGSVKIPKKLLEELKEKELLDCVEIININNPGTIERIKKE
jgi:DNA-binding transcriptional regulator PaaX